MKRLYCLFAILGLALSALGFDMKGLTPAGDVTGFKPSVRGITLSCADGTSVQLSYLAPDLVRVRAAFPGQTLDDDRSWAVVKSDWTEVKTTVSEDAGFIRVASDVLELRIQKRPLLLSFIERATGRVINSDERPLSRDAASGHIGVFKKLGLNEHFYGLGERTARLDRRRSEFLLWNSDTPGYVEGTDPLYQSIPFYMGLDKGKAYGVFHDNSFRSSFDLGRNTQDFAGFKAEGGRINYYFFYGPSMRDILARYGQLTGTLPMPPLWAMGHHQCRYSYYPDTVVEDIGATYRSRDLPLDALYLDIHYMDGYRSFTWDNTRFPDPKGMLSRLRDKGIRVVTIVDPGIKYQPSSVDEKPYHAYDQGVQGGHFLKRKNGTPYIGEVWPGKAVFADYTREETRKWWGDLHKGFLDTGIAGFWNDMNEPSDFIDKSGVTQQDVIFEDGGRNTSYLENRNLFGFLMSRATYDGLSRLRPNERPFIITRAGYAGIQRYAVTWTGDNNATWDSLALSLPIFQSMGLSGQAFVGADIPGFIGRGDGELMARCYQVSCFTPLFRNHGAVDMYDHEPWRFGAHYEAIIRKYIKLRYSLLPYLYTGIEEAHRAGMPVFRPLLLNFQNDDSCVNLDDEFMVGDALLAAPVLNKGERAREIYLPDALWYDFWTGARVEAGFRRFEAPIDHLPLFVRGGSILPSTVPMNHVKEKAWSPLRYDVYPDAQGAAKGSLYEDDGESLSYKEGRFLRSMLEFTSSAKESRFCIQTAGTHEPAPRLIELRIHGVASPRLVELDGQALAKGADAGAHALGWSLGGDGTLLVRFQDTGKAHAVVFR